MGFWTYLFSPRARQAVLIAVIVYLLLVVVATQIVLFPGNENSDFFSFWLAGKSLLLGEDPYEAKWWIDAHSLYDAGWVSDHTFLYPLPLAVIFILIGAMPFDLGYVIWSAFAMVAIIAMVMIAMSFFTSRLEMPYLVPILLSLLVFRPAYITIINGQLAAFFGLLTAVALLCFQGRRWFWGGFILCMTILKPQVGVPLIALLLIWLLVNRRWTGLYGLLAGAGTLLLVGMVFSLAWVVDFLAIAQHKVSNHFGCSPTVWGLSAMMCNFKSLGCVVSLGLVMFGGLIVFWTMFVARARQMPPLFAGSIAILLSVVLPPYMWTYDQVVLVIPLTMIVMSVGQRGVPYFLAALVPLGVSVFSSVLYFICEIFQMENPAIGLPLLLMVLWGWAFAKKIREGVSARAVSFP